MTATVTNINEYKAKKDGTNNIDYFSKWSDWRLSTRQVLLSYVVAGHTDLIDPKAPMVNQLFPGGYDPENNPGDNLAAVRAECERRGVFVKSV